MYALESRTERSRRDYGHREVGWRHIRTVWLTGSVLDFILFRITRITRGSSVKQKRRHDSVGKAARSRGNRSPAALPRSGLEQGLEFRGWRVKPNPPFPPQTLCRDWAASDGELFR